MQNNMNFLIRFRFANQKFISSWLTGWGVASRLGFIPDTLQRLEMKVVTNEGKTIP